jgi:hypothetical protein
MPPLAFAQEDEALFEKVSPQNLRVRDYQVKFQEAKGAVEDFRKVLARAGQSRLNPFNWRSNTVIVYVAAHGAVDEQGRPCLIPPNADPFDSQNWLKLSDVLQALKDEPAVKGKKKLLLLDAQRIVSCWRSGLLSNRFAEEAPKVVSSVGDPNLYVLMAAGPGEVAWAAPELRSSVFGHFVARGLRGEANPEGSSVSLAQLARYVSGRVDGYVQQRRGARQRPTLYATGGKITVDEQGRLQSEQGTAGLADITLAYVDAGAREANLASVQSGFDPVASAERLLRLTEARANGAKAGDQLHTSLVQLWKLYDQRRGIGAERSMPAASVGYICDPVAWASVQQRLAAVEERLLAGEEYQTGLQNQIDQLAAELAADKWRPAGEIPQINLIAAGWAALAASSQNVRDGGMHGQDARATQAGQDARVSQGNLLEAYLDPKEPDAAKKRDLINRAPRLKLAQDILGVLTQSGRPNAAGELTAAAQILSLRPPSGTGELIEAQFVSLIDRWTKLSGAAVARGDVVSALQTRQLAEQAATPSDIRVHYALERAVHAADEQRRQEEDRLYLGEAAGAGSAREPAEAAYRRAAEQGEKLAQALRVRDEIWSELPLVAEWYWTRQQLTAGAQSDELFSQQLIDLLEKSIGLAERLEQVILARDEEGAFAERYAECVRQSEDLQRVWRQIRLPLADVGRPLEVETTYKRGEDVGEVELAIRTPLLAADSGAHERYLNTLKGWAEDRSPRIEPAGEREVQGPAGPAGPTATHREFLKQLHRALDFEFGALYREHRHWDEWETARSADTLFRSASGQRAAVWNRVRDLLNEYNSTTQRTPPAVWGTSGSAVGGSAALRRWDSQARLASLWLCSGQADLRKPDQPTPGRWLQQYDAAHLTSWHAYRLARDFWGNGQEGAGGVPYFAAAIQQCAAALSPEYLPLRYDLPGGGAADFAERGESALAALRGWNPVKLQSRIAVPEAGGAVKFNVEVQPIGSEAAKALKVPPGVATLALAADAASPRLSFDGTRPLPLRGVNVPVPGPEPLRLAATATREGAAGTPGQQLTARLWYRGHVRSASAVLGAGFYVESHIPRRPYSVPTIEVRGRDTPHGSVMFVFDCSASMTSADGRFADAHRQFQEVLNELANNAGAGLKVGLMAYGHRTPASGLESQLFYRFGRVPGDPESLTELGSRTRAANPQAFDLRYPHPDRDVEVLLPVEGGTPAKALAKLNELTVERCVGCTPLYYSISRAMQTAFGGEAGQVVVISDGVNMPYDSDGSVIRSTGRRVNDSDLAEMENILARRRDIRVSVVLFGTRAGATEIAQFDVLQRLARDHANFQLVPVPNTRDIARFIRASFPKATIDLTSLESSGPGQSLAFQVQAGVADWPQDGLLRRDPDRRRVRLLLTGEATRLEKEIELIGGERVVLQYDPSRGRPELRFAWDGREASAVADAAAVGRVAEPARTSVVDVLDPIRNVGGVDLTFPFRIREKQWEQRFSPRPRFVWAEIQPRGGDDPARAVFPCVDANWEDQSQFPILQVPLPNWPRQSRRAGLRLWFRFDDPPTVVREPLPRGRHATLESAAGRWTVSQSGGEAGEPRRVVVSLEPSAENRRLDRLLEQAVWVWPPADDIHRRYAQDGSSAEHEFRYTRPGAAERDLDLRIVSRPQFQQGSYAVELEFDVVN